MPRRPPPLVPEDHSPVPPAAGGPRTPRDKSVALVLVASVLAAASLGMGRAPKTPAPQAPDCPPAGTVSWDDKDGCWTRRTDGTRSFRTSSGGRVYWHSSPPSGSRYYSSSSRSSGWSWSRSSGSSYRGSSSVGS